MSVGHGITISSWGGTLTALPNSFDVYGAQGAYGLTYPGGIETSVSFKVESTGSFVDISYQFLDDAVTRYNSKNGIIYLPDDHPYYGELILSIYLAEDEQDDVTPVGELKYVIVLRYAPVV